MNWEAIAAIAEALGAIAVVATLVYLSSQLRQNTATVRSNSATAHTQAVQAFTLAIAQDARDICSVMAGCDLTLPQSPEYECGATFLLLPTLEAG